MYKVFSFFVLYITTLLFATVLSAEEAPAVEADQTAIQASVQSVDTESNKTADTLVESQADAIDALFPPRSDDDAVGALVGGGNDTYSQLSDMVGGLGIVLIIILGLAWVVKKLNLPMAQQVGKLEVIATLPVSGKEKVMLIKVRNKEILIGVTANNISYLSEVPPASISELMEEDEQSQDLTQRKDGDFASKLYQILNKGSIK